MEKEAATITAASQSRKNQQDFSDLFFFNLQKPTLFVNGLLEFVGYPPVLAILH